MARTVTVSDELYARLETAAKQRGCGAVDKLLEIWQADEDERRRRGETVRAIDELRARLLATYGEMPDSAVLIREDRSR